MVRSVVFQTTAPRLLDWAAAHHYVIGSQRLIPNPDYFHASPIALPLASLFI